MGIGGVGSGCGGGVGLWWGTLGVLRGFWGLEVGSMFGGVDVGGVGGGVERDEDVEGDSLGVVVVVGVRGGFGGVGAVAVDIERGGFEGASMSFDGFGCCSSRVCRWVCGGVDRAGAEAGEAVGVEVGAGDCSCSCFQLCC